MKEERKVIHDREGERFYIDTSYGEATINYTLKNGIMEVYHTFVPGELRGRGFAGLLGEEAARTACREGLRIKPSCGFMAAFLKKNRKYSHLKK